MAEEGEAGFQVGGGVGVVGADAVAGEVDPGGGVEGGGEGIGLNPFVHFVHHWAERARWTMVRGLFCVGLIFAGIIGLIYC